MTAYGALPWQALVDEVKEQIEKEEDESNRSALKTLLDERESAVDQLMDKFAHLALEAAQKVGLC